MKKIAIILFCALIMAIMFPNTAKADIGPKPSVVIDFNGLDEKTYYATLLSSEKSTGPFSALNDSNHTYAHYQEDDEDYEIFLKFAEYHDVDGYYFLQFFKNCTGSNRFSWTYYPPQDFKILLYFPETDSFIISENHYERYAFDSYFTAEVSNTDISAKKSYEYTNETLSLIVRILLTIIAELGIALVFGFGERKQFRFIIFVNVITQIALNIALNIINYHSGELAFIVFYILLEVAVFIMEAVLYTWYLKKNSQKEIPGWKPGIYALTANAVSFTLGFGLAYCIPGIF
ncbi:hypothetical protein SAMN02746066_04332 [Anaerosporobacter mobilis DSM 15930]|uniref:Uncharacterized protein n=1 Tax=Anaerosporobacter mobilis DSM 15930 TaxID=1120996 RepID=A0A1M7NBJ9_9FIRM|nr:hypothetical protein [Anaerosporobacter mobilis]SHN00490.1 hypothetical protein SAMN02746066_04332 [Anaerosporobacter mobilis DSM 15930]